MIDQPDQFASDVAPSRRPDMHWALRVHRIKFIARRYWWIAALTIMIGLGSQGYLCLHQVTHYSSSSRMIMSGRLSLPQGDVYSDLFGDFFGTQVALMKSPATINQAVDRITTTHPEIVPDEKAIVEAEVEPRTSIFNLKVTSSDADYAKLLLDAVMDTYLANKRGRKNQTTDEALSAITEEISHLDSEIRSDEQGLLDFQKDNNVVFIEEQSSSSAQYLVGLNNELARLIKQRDLLSLENKDPLLANNFNSSTAGLNPGTASSAPAAPTSTTPVTPDSTSPETSTTPVSTTPSAPAQVTPGTPPSPSSTDSTATKPAITGTATVDNNLADLNPILVEQDKIEQLKISRDQLGIYLKDKHPKMIELADAIDKEQKFLDALKQRNAADRDAFREDLDLQITNLQTQIDAANKSSLKLSESLGTYQELKNKISREQGLYNQLAMSIQNVDFNKSLDQEDVVIMEAASKAKPIPPDTVLRLVYGFAGGLVAGIALIYLVNRLDDKIDSPLQIEENIDYPIVGQIPVANPDKRTKRVPILTDSDQRHDYLEYHRSLRSAILFRSFDAAKLRSLMICSAAPGEGKSTLAANMAIVFAHSGLRVLLIDADLRRGVLSSLFDLPSEPGLSDYLRHTIAWRETVLQTKIANVHLIPRGTIQYRSGDLLLGPAADILLQESITHYDLVLWDSAPLLAAHDAVNLCSKVDGVLFVARVRHSSINSVRSALDDLAQRNANIFGIVLNAVAPNQPGYFHKYRYKEYYETV
jgi:capsular exopolysaccharide synthesis family protein